MLLSRAFQRSANRSSGWRVGQGTLRGPAGWVLALDVVKYRGDEFRLGDVCDGTKFPTALATALATTQWSQCDIEVKDVF